MLKADVAVLAPVPGPYTYAVPARLQGEIVVGSRVWVPLRQRHLEGVVLHLSEGADEEAGGLKPIRQRIDCPPLPADLLRLAEFIADYYLVPRGEALRLVLPVGAQVHDDSEAELTEAGAALSAQLDGALLPIAASGLGEAARAVLRDLRERGGAKLRPVPLRRLGGGAALPEALSALQAAGLVRLRERLQPGSKALTETIVAPAPDAAAAMPGNVALRGAPKRAAILKRLRAEGPLPLSALRAADPRAKAHVEALQAAGLVTTATEAQHRDPLAGRWREVTEAAGGAPPPVLTPEQAQVLARLKEALGPAAGDGSGSEGGGRKEGGAFLLHGVTGSGKTEIYLQLIAAALARGRTALVLVPEIGLTPQLAARFRSRFGPDVAVLHSALTQAERADSWGRLLRGEVRIALGARSALFAPLSRLGVIIVDEEHDASFKQQDGVRYHGRDLALLRAQQAGAVTVLGSATPSLEALSMAETGKLALLSLPGRPGGRPMPAVRTIDLRQHLLGPEDGLISAPLRAAMEESLGAGEQVILFLNRRGYATFLLCKGCGHRFECRNCAVTLTWHKGRGDLLCHYCGYVEALPERCPVCTAEKIDRLGLGTQKIEEQVAAQFPAARVGRLDRDTAEGEGLARVLGAMHRRELDILIGTQMLAKGHDFPYVTLVGVVLADTGIGLPDFRASERTFQLLAQVAGRAGRAERPGQVLIQTYNPEHPAIACAGTHDYLGFARGELQARRELGYPPASRLCVLRFDGVDPLAVRQAAGEVAQQLRQVAERAPAEAEVTLLGPAEAPLSRLKGKTRWQMLLRAKNVRAVRTIVRAGLAVQVDRAVRVSADIDPVSTL